MSTYVDKTWPSKWYDIAFLWAVEVSWAKSVNADSGKGPRVRSTSGSLRKHQDEGGKIFKLRGTSAGDSQGWQKHIQDSL